jgi:hypothetical protein
MPYSHEIIRPWRRIQKDAAMRNESMDFVAIALLIPFLTANVARARSDLKCIIEVAALDQSLIWKDPFRDLDRDRAIAAPRMFNWSVCSRPTNGSGLLTDFMNHSPLQHTQEPARLKQVCTHGCVHDDGDEEETQNANLVAGATFLDRGVTDPPGSVCDLGSLRYASLELLTLKPLHG